MNRISKITVARLYNLGSYEHVRYELTVEVPEGASATNAIIGVEKILAGLSPLKNACIKSEQEIERLRREIQEMRTMPVADWERRYGSYQGTVREIIERHEAELNESIAKRAAALSRSARARELFDDLGGAEKWTDAKLDWDDEDRL
jgi:hypothetical protein